MRFETVEAGGDLRFYLSPVVPAEKMLANMRSAIARGLSQVTPCRAHDLVMSIAGGGPSLADTYQDMEGWICAVNGSLRWLFERELKPGASYACGIMDAGEHIADLIVADPSVRYYVASICDPSVFDKLKDCDVRLWHVSPDSTEDPEGVKAVLNEAYPERWHAIGGGCTMGLRWINLGFFLGFRRFHLHGMDSSFRDGSTHAYPDRADVKDHFVFRDRETRPNFVAQVYDFRKFLDQITQPGHERVDITVFGDGLLQDDYQDWLRDRHERISALRAQAPGSSTGTQGDGRGLPQDSLGKPSDGASVVSKDALSATGNRSAVIANVRRGLIEEARAIEASRASQLLVPATAGCMRSASLEGPENIRAPFPQEHSHDRAGLPRHKAGIGAETIEVIPSDGLPDKSSTLIYQDWLADREACAIEASRASQLRAPAIGERIRAPSLQEYSPDCAGLPRHKPDIGAKTIEVIPSDGLPDKSSTLITCVKTGIKYGPEYVVNLRDGVARYLKTPHDFVCFTDDPVDGVQCAPLPVDLPGWWAKLGLFKLRRPLIYFDLDVVITGDLSPLLEWDGFGIIKDWWLPGFNSSVMKLTGDEGDVWTKFTPDVMQRCEWGDQQHISECLPEARTFPPEYFPSFKANRCAARIPAGALAVIFHGRPNPHECGGWVAEYWNGSKERISA